MKIIRTDNLLLQTDKTQQSALADTLDIYRCFVRDLMLLINAQWKALQHYSGDEVVGAIERLIHPTSQRPVVKYRYFHRRYYKFPSYLRRVAINDAFGQVQSFRTRFELWLDGDRKKRPPKLTCATGTFPSLYRGQCIKFNESFTAASIKVFYRNDWVWMIIKVRGEPRYFDKGEQLSPLLVFKNKRWMLSIPQQLNVSLKDKKTFSKKVLAVDVGINTDAVCAVVDKYGTVYERKFFNRQDKDRVYRLMQRIRNKARKQTRHGNKLFKGFCSRTYRQLQHVNQNQAHHISRYIVNMAIANGCDAVVVENLKFFRPRGGKKGSALRMRFHNWYHRRLIEYVSSKAKEAGLRVIPVYARGTSSYAYDGSGKVTRDKNNYANAVFTNGKKYNADLSASYNIAARGIMKLHHPLLAKRLWSEGRPNACPTTGNPLSLSSLWRLNESKAG